jgi:glutathione S-transferase
MYTLYSMQRSDAATRCSWPCRNCASFRSIEVDILKGESHTPEFLAKNPNGQVPLLEVAPGAFIAESNAILWYIADHTPLAPDDRIERAEMLQWMFFEQHSLEPNIGAAYFWRRSCGGRTQGARDRSWGEVGYQALGVMEEHSKSIAFSRPTATPSPTSPSTPIRTSPMPAISISRISIHSPGSARGRSTAP